MSLISCFRYRTYRRPRYKVAYKMVTEMEWKCCHGYSGEDCHIGPQVSPDNHGNSGQSQVTQTSHNTGGGQMGGEGKISVSEKLFFSSVNYRNSATVYAMIANPAYSETEKKSFALICNTLF